MPDGARREEAERKQTKQERFPGYAAYAHIPGDDMLEYLKRSGEISLAQSPLNDVDRLIFAQLAYVDLSCAEPGMTLAQALGCALFAREDTAQVVRFGFQSRDDSMLCEQAALARRYENIRFLDFTDVFDARSQTQFAAMTVALPDDTLLVAFRGTDNTVAGWKEDFNLAFLEEVPAQALARAYAESRSPFDAPMEICGHSKGGNLALYAAVRSDARTRARIRQAVSFDGPGLSEKLTQSDEFAQMQPRMRVLLPRASLVGRLFTQPENVQLVESRTLGMLQHYPYTWKTEGMGFDHAERASGGSLLAGDMVNALLRRLTLEEREQFVEAVYDIVTATQAETVNELLRGWIANTLPVLQKLLRTKPETYRLFLRVLNALWQSMLEAAGLQEREEINK